MDVSAFINVCSEFRSIVELEFKAQKCLELDMNSVMLTLARLTNITKQPQSKFLTLEKILAH
ncbi:CLUMA_CG018455, isoform A [Clunio marinus]|uniref:CLUMA_CG018455, isoform A n=1 Tax=Clunio marinus TaxID=568069 RepID=A0A1J1IZE5_9DIPT|nr:CLUMA_CG018455, isoform A [Clunio marinus]